MKKIYYQYVGVLSSIVFIMLMMSCIIFEPTDPVDNTNFSASESFSYQIDVQGQRHLKIEAINSRIDITGVENQQFISVSGERFVKSESEADAESHLDELEISITENVDEVRIKTIQPKDTQGRTYQIRYQIKVPADMDVTVQSVNGDVTLDSLKSDLVVGVVNGNIVLDEISGDVTVGLTNGNIRCEMVLPTQGTCQLSVINGQIELAIPMSTSANFSANVTNGSVSINDLQLQNPQSTNRSLSGILGTGLGKIKLVTVNGSITVNGY